MTRTIPQPPANIAGYDPLRTAADCWWDGVEAARAVDFFTRVLTHPDDSHYTKAGDPLTLAPWQADYVATLFGWKRADRKTRRYTESFVALPRKNGKSTIAAGIILYCMVADGRTAGQYYTAAETRDQASLVYRMAAQMVKHSPLLSRKLKPIASTRTITFQQRGSFMRSIPSEAGPVHGTKPAAVIFDEVHTQKNRDLYDALRTGQGATPNPLFISITTAGHDRHSICFELWNTARQVRDEQNSNPYFLPCIYELAEGADWKDESTWAACNPNLGVSVSLDFLREECQRAKDSYAYENTFRNWYLNQWTEQAVRWIQMDKWHLGDEPLPELRDESCWVAIDMSSNKDITAVVAAFQRPEGGCYLLCKFWVPAESGRKRDRMDGVPYTQWHHEGHIEFTEGDSVDDQAIRKYVNELERTYKVQEVTVDPWNARPLMNQLINEDGFGERVTEHRPGMPSMAGPTKEFDRLITDGKIQHGNHPLLTWMAGNVAVVKDTHENFRPCKEKSTERIDGIVAAVMAVGRAVASIDTTSIYETRGIVSLGEGPEPVTVPAKEPDMQWGGNWGNDDD